MSRRLAAALLVVLASATPVAAQLNPFGRIGATVTDDDIALARGALDELRGDAVAVGEERAWENPATGNRGRVKYIEAMTIDGLPCRKMVHQFRLDRQSDPRYSTVITCKTADGSWKSAF